MKKQMFLVAALVLVSCAPSLAQATPNTSTQNNYKGLQSLVNDVNSSNSAGAGGGGGGGKHRWKGGGAGSWNGGNNAGGSSGGSTAGSFGGSGASSIGAGAGPTGSGLDGGKGKGGGKFAMDPAKREERRQRMMKRFDSNGDGVLDDAEKAKAKAFREERRARRQAMGGGAGFGGAGGGGFNGGGQGGLGEPGGQGMGRKHHRRMMDQQSVQDGSAPSLPGGRRGGPGDFPNGFPNGTGSTSNGGATSTTP